MDFTSDGICYVCVPVERRCLPPLTGDGAAIHFFNEEKAMGKGNNSQKNDKKNKKDKKDAKKPEIKATDTKR